MRLEETLEQLAKQHNHLERAFRGATVLPPSQSNPAADGKGNNSTSLNQHCPQRRSLLVFVGTAQHCLKPQKVHSSLLILRTLCAKAITESLCWKLFHRLFLKWHTVVLLITTNDMYGAWEIQLCIKGMCTCFLNEKNSTVFSKMYTHFLNVDLKYYPKMLHPNSELVGQQSVILESKDYIINHQC